MSSAIRSLPVSAVLREVALASGESQPANGKLPGDAHAADAEAFSGYGRGTGIRQDGPGRLLAAGRVSGPMSFPEVQVCARVETVPEPGTASEASTSWTR